MHRLDRDTSGLMVYAKDMETEQILEHNWHQIVYDRRYVAVVSGEMEQDEGTVEKSVSNRTVSSENVSRLPALLLNESLSVQAVNIAIKANRENKSRLTIYR